MPARARQGDAGSRWAQTIRPATWQARLDRSAVLARQAKVTRARKRRLDSTCVQTPIHHPTDSGLLGDGVRVLTRLLRRARPLVQDQLAGVRQAFRSRLRACRRLLQQLHRVRRLQGDAAAEQQRNLYRRLLDVTRRTMHQAERVRQARAASWGAESQSLRSSASPQGRVAHRLLAQLDDFLPLVRQGIQQAQQRVLDGQPVPSAHKVLSLFEPHTHVVKRGKLTAAVEFGRQVVVDEVEGGLVTRFHALADDESECRQALPAVAHHRAVFGRPPWLVTGDRKVHTQGLEAEAHALGVTHVVIPRIGRLTATQRAREQQRAWKRRYRWRAGIEGRIHSLRRDDGLARCRSHGEEGLARDVGWGTLASNLRHIAPKQATDRTPRSPAHNQTARSLRLQVT